jgi:DNA repair and recombination protein RAD52
MDQYRVQPGRGQAVPPQRPLQQHQPPQKSMQNLQTQSHPPTGVTSVPSQHAHHFQRPQHSPSIPGPGIQARSGHPNLPQSGPGAGGAEGSSRPQSLDEDSNSVRLDSGPGFVTARGVVNTKGDDATPLPQAPAFNPRTDSPSIRKTNGIDHTKSRPVPREAATGALIPSINGADDPLITHRGNGINPQLEGIRQIGRPPAIGSGGMNIPLQNRGQFKMPSPAVNIAAGNKRPAEVLAAGYDPHLSYRHQVPVRRPS